MNKQQRGRFMLGLGLGVLLGLVLAAAVAIYVNKVPAPFVNKVPQRSAAQDAAEAERNKNWDANAPLAGKTPMHPAEPASAPAAPAAATPPLRDPAAILAGRPVGDAPAPAAASARASSDPFIYFVQAGAYGRAEDAEQQRARLAMLGLAARITEREQAGRTVYRVRVGPYDRKEDAEAGRAKLEGGGVEAALVRVQK